jgi:hypothetical protein
LLPEMSPQPQNGGFMTLSCDKMRLLQRGAAG